MRSNHIHLQSQTLLAMMVKRLGCRKKKQFLQLESKIAILQIYPPDCCFYRYECGYLQI